MCYLTRAPNPCSFTSSLCGGRLRSFDPSLSSISALRRLVGSDRTQGPRGGRSQVSARSCRPEWWCQAAARGPCPRRRRRRAPPSHSRRRSTGGMPAGPPVPRSDAPLGAARSRARSHARAARVAAAGPPLPRPPPPPRVGPAPPAPPPPLACPVGRGHRGRLERALFFSLGPRLHPPLAPAPPPPPVPRPPSTVNAVSPSP